VTVVTAPVRPVTLTTTGALAASGVSYRRLDYWCRVGVFDTIPRFEPNPGSGVSRRWSVEHVQALTVCGRLADAFTEDTAWPKNVPTRALAYAVAALVRHAFPTDGVLMVTCDDAVISDDPDTILGHLLAGPPLLVLPLLRTDRPE
jgi:hypothetical protein